MHVLTCPGCSSTYDVTSRPAGQRIRCPACRTELVVPEPEADPGEAVRERARRKLVAALRKTGPPVGGNVTRTVLLAIVCAIPWLLGVLIVLAATADGGRLGAGLFWVTVVLVPPLAPWPILAWFRSRPSSPAKALREFYRCLARGETRRAYDLVTEADRDAVERHQPDLGETIGNPSHRALRFDSPDGFRDYWNEMLRSHTMPICYVRCRQLRFRLHGPDVAIASFELEVRTNTNLYLLLVLGGGIGILIGAILQHATFKTARAPVQRVLVREGEEWRLFSGEWQGWEEADPSWLGDDVQA